MTISLRDTTGLSPDAVSLAPLKLLPDHIKPSDVDFHRTNLPVWHDVRRKQMLKLYPEIKELYGYDHLAAAYCTCTVLLQCAGAYLVKDLPFFPLIILTYSVSGTINHSLVLALHEVSHNNFFATSSISKWFALFANLPVGFPMAVTFKRYHNEHHWGLAVEGVDADLPTRAEALLFGSPIGRAFWIFLQPFFYALRPVIVHPKTISFDEIVNWVTCIFFDCCIFMTCGINGVIYLLAGSILGMGIHPISGHFVAEHYEFFPAQETASYYGPLNLLTYNVGYHVEHHDFPRIPGRFLPRLHRIAPEFYAGLGFHTSWIVVLWKFCTEMSLFKRLVRAAPEGTQSE